MDSAGVLPVGTIELAAPFVRKALTLGFDKPGTIRQGTKDDTLDDVEVADGGTQSTSLSLTVGKNGEDFEPRDSASTYTKR